mmetsp:Transcript_47143/g.131583  ORF Transcript_47143/g.131583 Transcript_47143/m.131583 type:complete len:245 (-) Transcript_47143:1201-1935(-)
MRHNLNLELQLPEEPTCRERLDRHRGGHGLAEGARGLGALARGVPGARRKGGAETSARQSLAALALGRAYHFLLLVLLALLGLRRGRRRGVAGGRRVLLRTQRLGEERCPATLLGICAGALKRGRCRQRSKIGRRIARADVASLGQRRQQRVRSLALHGTHGVLAHNQQLRLERWHDLLRDLRLATAMPQDVLCLPLSLGVGVLLHHLEKYHDLLADLAAGAVFASEHVLAILPVLKNLVAELQ